MMRKDGFTLIEVLVTIVVLGILAAVAIPGFSRYGPDMRLRSAVRDLKSTMELSKLKAIRENAFVALVFDTGNNTYTVFLDNGEGGGTPDDWTPNGDEEVVRTVNLPSDVTMYEASFPGGVPRFRFDSRGLPNGLGGHVYMRNTKNNYRGIRLNMVGRIRIESSTDGGSWDEAD